MFFLDFWMAKSTQINTKELKFAELQVISSSKKVILVVIHGFVQIPSWDD